MSEPAWIEGPPPGDAPVWIDGPPPDTSPAPQVPGFVQNAADLGRTVLDQTKAAGEGAVDGVKNWLPVLGARAAVRGAKTVSGMAGKPLDVQPRGGAAPARAPQRIEDLPPSVWQSIKANPGYAAGYIGASALDPVGLMLPEARLAQMPRLAAGIARVAGRDAALGGAQTALSEYTNTGELPKAGDVAQAAGISGALGAGLRLPRGVALAKQRPVSAQQARDVETLRAAGITSLRPAQVSGNDAAIRAEAGVGWLGGKGRADKIIAEQERQVNRAVNREMGIGGDRALTDPERIAHQKALGDELGSIYDRGHVPPIQVETMVPFRPVNDWDVDPKQTQLGRLPQDPRAVFRAAGILDPEGRDFPDPPNDGLSRDVARAFRDGASGPDYKRLRAELRTKAVELGEGPTPQPERALWYWSARRALDRRFQAGDAADAARLPTARHQYRSTKRVTDLREKDGIIHGNYDLPALMEATKRADPNWANQDPARWHPYIRLGEAADKLGVTPRLKGVTPKAAGESHGPSEPWHVRHHALATVGGPAAAIAAASAIHPSVGVPALVAWMTARGIASPAWYGVPYRLPPLAAKAAGQIPYKLTAAEAEDDTP